MAKNKTPMTQKAARRIQSAADRSGKNQAFKARAQSSSTKKGSSSTGATTKTKKT